MAKYTEKDAAKDTDVSIKEVNETWHAARDDAQKSGELPEREESKVDEGVNRLVSDAFKEDDTSSKEEESTSSEDEESESSKDAE